LKRARPQNVPIMLGDARDRAQTDRASRRSSSRAMRDDPADEDVGRDPRAGRQEHPGHAAVHRDRGGGFREAVGEGPGRDPGQGSGRGVPRWRGEAGGFRRAQARPALGDDAVRAEPEGCAGSRRSEEVEAASVVGWPSGW